MLGKEIVIFHFLFCFIYFCFRILKYEPHFLVHNLPTHFQSRRPIWHQYYACNLLVSSMWLRNSLLIYSSPFQFPSKTNGCNTKVYNIPAQFIAPCFLLVCLFYLAFLHIHTHFSCTLINVTLLFCCAIDYLCWMSLDLLSHSILG